MEEENLCPVAPLGLSVFPTDPYVDSISNAFHRHRKSSETESRLC